MAYQEAKKFLLYGLAGSLLLSVVVFFVSPWYVRIFNVETGIRELTIQILAACAAVMPFKVLNMIIGSGGKTTYYYIDFECNDYMEQWDFEHWGFKYWSKMPEFLRYAKEHTQGRQL